jgi:hypothetical protein
MVKSRAKKATEKSRSRLSVLQHDIDMAMGRAKRLTEKPRSPLWVLQHIDSVHCEELDALADRLSRDPEYMRAFLVLTLRSLQVSKFRARLAELLDILTRLKEMERYVEALRSNAELAGEVWEVHRKSELELAASRRKMSQARVETAEAFVKLQKKHSKQIAAGHALVRLPGEQRKRYAVKFREYHDEEALRQYVKNLMRTYRKYEEHLAFLKVCEDKPAAADR